MLTELTVPETARGLRLDVWLAEALEGCTRSLVSRLIKQECCALTSATGKPLKVKAGYALDGGEQVSMEVPEDEPMEARPEDIPLTVLYEDARILVLDKPAGMVVHPAIGHLRGTLVNGLLGRYGTHLASGEGWRPGIVHRLDAETSGVIVVARDDEALRSLQDAFKARIVRKRYLALAAGTPVADFLSHEGAIGRHPKDFRKRMVRPLGEGDAKEASTTFLVHKRCDGYSVVEARPHTGRTHQIRVHLAALGHPILADVVYGRSRTWPLQPVAGKPLLKRHALHAWTLEIPHPDDGRMLTFSAPIPADLAPWIPAGIAPKPR
jgi:23S rRNA pseudouridine1911/1915/1917 synthase